MIKKKKVGIAGYGVVGKRRRHYIDAHPIFKTVAVSDIKFPKDVQKIDGVRAYNNYKPLLKEDLDVLFVCVPNYIAPIVTIGGLKNGLHVFCEKPPGRFVQDIEQVIAVEKTKPDLILKYGFNHRYHDSVKEAMRIISSGEMGDVVNMRGVYGKSKVVPFSGGWRAERKYAGGGILLDQGIHMLDLMRLFCGEFNHVKSFVSNNFWNHDVEDNAHVVMKDDKQRIAMIHSSATQWGHHFSLDIFLTKGHLKLSGLLTSSKSYGEETLQIGWRSQSEQGTLKTKIIKYLADNSWKQEIEEFADAILNKKPILFGTSDDALNTMKLVYRIYYADKDWREKYNISNPDKK
jgi:predicted dehydrogenase